MRNTKREMRAKILGLTACMVAMACGMQALAVDDLPPLQPITPKPLPSVFTPPPHGQAEDTVVTPPVVPAGPGKPVHAELNDGTQIEFGLDGSVSILNKDGSKDPAPDGVLTLKDGVTFAVKGGQRVDE